MASVTFYNCLDGPNKGAYFSPAGDQLSSQHRIDLAVAVYSLGHGAVCGCWPAQNLRIIFNTCCSILLAPAP